jgi:phage terminase Nu1 subunit (DNA packaging protein)
MKKPAIFSLSSAQRQEVVNTLDEILKENNYRYKDLVLETLDFVKVLMEELKSGKISTNQLKQILLSLDQEALKKLSEIH